MNTTETILTTLTTIYLIIGLLAATGFIQHRINTHHQPTIEYTLWTIIGTPIAILFWPGILVHEQL